MVPFLVYLKPHQNLIWYTEMTQAEVSKEEVVEEIDYRNHAK